MSRYLVSGTRTYLLLQLLERPFTRLRRSPNPLQDFLLKDPHADIFVGSLVSGADNTP